MDDVPQASDSELPDALSSYAVSKLRHETEVAHRKRWPQLIRH